MPLWLAWSRAGFALLVEVGVVVLGAVLIVSGWHTRAQERPVRGWDTTTGTVIGVHRVADKNGYVFGPIVSFSDRTGARHYFTAPTSSDESTVCARAQVAYDSNNPARAHDVSASGTSWAASFVTGIFIVTVAGLMLVLISWVLIRQRRRNKRLGHATAGQAGRSARR